MENYHSAFLPGEYVLIQSEAALEQIQQIHKGEPSQLGLHTVMPANLTAFAGQRALITGRSYYHFGWALYELGGLPGYWPEAALIDQELGDPEAADDLLAARTYVAQKSGDGKFVEICSRDGERFCSLRKRDVDEAVADINRVAGLRSRSSFAQRYEFDGIESQWAGPEFDAI